jgi:hypothetical protein
MGRLHRDIAALADGSYEAPGLRERIAGSPELTVLFEEQRRAVEATRAARPPAPAALRAAVAERAAGAPVAGDAVPAARRRRRDEGRRRRPALGLVLATAGVLALAVVAVLPSGGAPTVGEVSTLAARGPTAGPPAPDAAHHGALASEIDGVRYPDWRAAFGWRESGARTDRLDRRPAMTVYYAGPGRATVAYSIVGGSPLPEPRAASTASSAGTRYLALTRAGRSIVTWRRAGHTCVISATGVPVSTLLRLAEWRYDATLA